MKINVNSINNILYSFYETHMIPKYEEAWRNKGENTFNITTKVFGYTLIAKLSLQGDITQKLPILLTLIDKDNNIDLDNVKTIVNETIKEFKDKGKNIIIPNLEWELDEKDIDKIYELSKNYEIKDK